jgi:hypothetical protein
VTSTLVLLVALAAGTGLRSLLIGPDAPPPRAAAPPAEVRTVGLDGYAGQPAEQVRARALAGPAATARLRRRGTAGRYRQPGGPRRDVAVGNEVVVHVVPPPGAAPPGCSLSPSRPLRHRVAPPLRPPPAARADRGAGRQRPGQPVGRAGGRKDRTGGGQGGKGKGGGGGKDKGGG